MAKYRVAVLNTVGKSILIDDALPSQVAALTASVAALTAGGTTQRHSSLLGLQQGDDHPQYAMWQAAETVIAPWNFQAEPSIEGMLLTEFIQDVVGNELVTNTASITWDYGDTAATLEANIVDEYVQDLVGAMLADTSSIDLSYNDLAGTFSAAIIDEYVQDLMATTLIDSTSIDFTYSDVGGTISAATINANPSGLIGMSAVNGTAATPLRSDGRHAIDPAIVPTWTGLHVFTVEPRISAAGNAGFICDDTGSGLNEKRWHVRSDTARLAITTQTDAGADTTNAAVFTRSGTTPTSLKLPNDNFQLQLGAGDDLSLYYDGTNGHIRVDAGVLLFDLGATAGPYFGLNGAVGAQFLRNGTAANPSLCFDNSTAAGLFRAGSNEIGVATNGVEVARFDANATAGNTRFMIYDVDNATLERVTVGVADSGGAGFKVLRIPN